MGHSLHSDIQALWQQLDAVDQEALSLVSGLTEEQAVLRPSPHRWSVAECLDHLAQTNLLYLAAMRPAALTARARQRMRRGPAVPGRLGGWFVSRLEPPVKRSSRMKSPRNILPQSDVSLKEAIANLQRSHEEFRAFLDSNGDLDLASIRFPNPILKVLPFSLATGLCNMLAHERRHLWQARQAVPIPLVSNR